MPRNEPRTNTSEAPETKAPAPLEHCYHRERDGTKTSAPTGENRGIEWGRCCQCGRPMRRTWREEKRPIDGHGPHVGEVQIVYDAPVLTAYGHETDPCEPTPVAP